MQSRQVNPCCGVLAGRDLIGCDAVLDLCQPDDHGMADAACAEKAACRRAAPAAQPLRQPAQCGPLIGP